MDHMDFLRAEGFAFEVKEPNSILIDIFKGKFQELTSRRMCKKNWDIKLTFERAELQLKLAGRGKCGSSRTVEEPLDMNHCRDTRL